MGCVFGVYANNSKQNNLRVHVRYASNNNFILIDSPLERVYA